MTEASYHTQVSLATGRFGTAIVYPALSRSSQHGGVIRTFLRLFGTVPRKARAVR